MINSYYFDTDCLSSFIKVGREDLLIKLFKNEIYIPTIVYNEISKISRLQNKVQLMFKNKDAIKIGFEVGSDIYKDFSYLIDYINNKHYIGYGEAACIALVKNKGGVLVSNNFKDISYYIEKYNLKHLSSGDILKLALNNKLITMTEADNIWRDMINEGDYLPYDSFSEFFKIDSNNKWILM